MMYKILRNPIISHYLHRNYCKSTETQLLKQLQARIKLKGPLTVADYMKEALTNPVAGYYMHKDVFGTGGDFTTSPEISQMFGELIGIWCVNEWLQCGSPAKLQVIEFGPGRGTLSDDMLRVFSKFDGIKDAVSLHLVEVSPKLSEMQRTKLTQTDTQTDENDNLKINDNDHINNSSTKTAHYKHCVSKYDQDVYWYTLLQQVPKATSFYIAHEFFDALPIHKFQKKDGSWQEVLVDVDDSTSGPHHLRYVLAGTETAASKILLKVDDDDRRDHIELSPDSGVIVEDIADRIATHGGFSLIADYGHKGTKTDTFRGFKNHALHDPLCEPGLADLTADVDFSYLSKIAHRSNVSTYGPVTQEKFLHNMGIGLRMQVLLGTATNEQRKNLITAYDMLTNPEKMGERFKFMAITNKRTDDYKPAGFLPLQNSS